MLNTVDRLAASASSNGDASLAPALLPWQLGARHAQLGIVPSPASRGREQAVGSADWELLLNAVKSRLGASVADWLTGPHNGARHGAGEVRADVLECVTALDQLQAMLVHEFSRFQQLELDAFDAQTALAQARAELAGTQAGERRARHLALHDSLTSLPNRSYFRQRLGDALALSEPLRQPLAVLYLDLDGFKPINDAHGHDAGDELLRIVAARLSRAVRAGDMVSRLGGDEFACLLADRPSREQLRHLACKLFDAVSAPVKIGSLKLSVLPSIGIAIYPADGLTTELLLKNADAAMYAAKRDRTGYAFCAPDGGAR